MAMNGTKQGIEHNRDASHQDARVAAAELSVRGVDDAHLAQYSASVSTAMQVRSTRASRTMATYSWKRKASFAPSQISASFGHVLSAIMCARVRCSIYRIVCSPHARTSQSI